MGADYRYGFNGHLKDNEWAGIGNSYDYGARMEDTRIGRFRSIDPLTQKYPMLTPYQFSSNSPISGGDRDGLEYYYGSDGSLLWKYGNSTQVRLVNDDYVKKNDPHKSTPLSTLNENSKDVGMTNDELNVRAFMSLIKKTEGHGRTTAYNVKYGGKTFNDYADHPGGGRDKNGVFHSPAGAYQITKGTWEQESSKLNLSDFKPASQDAAALDLIKSKKSGFNAVINGDIKGASDKLGGTWSSLPGSSEQGMSLEDAKKAFKTNVSNELNGKSDIASPKGSLNIDNTNNQTTQNTQTTPNTQTIPNTTN